MMAPLSQLNNVRENGMVEMAKGTHAVNAGRVIMEPLKKNGSEGVKDQIIKMTEELAGVMARTCSPDLNHIDPSVIWRICQGNQRIDRGIFLFR